MNVVMFSKYIKVIAQVLGVVGPVLIFIYHVPHTEDRDKK